MSGPASVAGTSAGAVLLLSAVVVAGLVWAGAPECPPEPVPEPVPEWVLGGGEAAPVSSASFLLSVGDGDFPGWVVGRSVARSVDDAGSGRVIRNPDSEESWTGGSSERFDQ